MQGAINGNTQTLSLRFFLSDLSERAVVTPALLIIACGPAESSSPDSLGSFCQGSYVDTSCKQYQKCHLHLSNEEAEELDR